MKRHHPFNLVEILIALGVTVIGICSIMVLFPIGANASSNAAMETYAANAADQMLNYLKFQITASEDNWKDMVVGSDATKGALKEIADIIDDDDDLTFDQSDLNDDDNWTYKKETSKHAYFNLKDMNGTIYSYCPSADTKANNLFQFISHRNELDSSGNPVYLGDSDFKNEKIDFRGLLQVWKEQVEIRLPDGSPQPPLDYKYCVKLNVRVLWPAEIPPKARQNAVYSLEVFNPFVVRN